MTSTREAVAALLLATLGALFINVEPSIAAALGNGYHLDSAALGAVLSIEAAGSVAGGFFAFLALARGRPRFFTICALIAYVAGNIATVFVHTAIALTLVRAATGVAEGSIIGIAFAFMASTNAPHRIFGVFGMVQTFSAVCAFAILGWLTHRYGWQAAFVCIAAAGALCFFAVPKRFTPVQTHETSGAIGRAGAFGLLSILVFFTSEASIWPFLERIGASRGVGDVAIAGALSFGALCGLAGSAAITALPARAVGIRTFSLTAALNISAIAILAIAGTAYAFFVALGLFNFAWAAFAPLQLSLLKKLDATPRTFTIASTATTIGFAFGPALGGVLAHAGGYMPAFGVGIIGTLFALALIATPLSYASREEWQRSAKRAS